jgi:histone acetyltransferase (RNA polymerase elongator complex component)
MVSEDILDMLRKSGFAELEIGIQSMDDAVLNKSERGHTKEDAIQACMLVKRSGMKLGIQLMPGLPGEDIQGFRQSIDEVLEIGPDHARIYPTVVLAGTRLEDMYHRGEYLPLTLDEAVHRTLYAVIRLENAGCTILRMGIPAARGLRITAGPYHDSFGFLVRARGYRIMAQRLMSVLGPNCELKVHSTVIPELVGYERSTLRELKFSYSFDDTLPRGYIRAYGSRESSCIQLQDILEYIL